MDQTNPTPSPAPAKSKKGLFITIGVIVLILIIWAVSRGASKNAENASMNGVDVNQHMDGSTTYSNEQGSVTVGGNKLPDNWPSDAPTYPGATIQYSGSSNPQTGEKGSTVVFITSDSAQKVVDFYKKELAAKGWTVEQSANMGASTVMAGKKDTRTFGIYVVDGGSGKVSVTVGIVTGTASSQ